MLKFDFIQAVSLWVSKDWEDIVASTVSRAFFLIVRGMKLVLKTPSRTFTKIKTDMWGNTFYSFG